jgi:radical S-adenosyl methionine domain-containing protein 2
MKNISFPPTSPLPSANWHITEVCNFQCTYCYATFSKMPVRSPVSLVDGKKIISMLANAGVDKITFVGGEPTLHPHLTAWAAYSKSAGLVTAMITNGTRLVPKGGHAVLEYLDWCGLSMDSGSITTQAVMGRRVGNPITYTARFAEIVRGAGVVPKLNSVITSLNVDEDLTELVQAINPARWKIFQYLPVEDERYDKNLIITATQFADFVSRHSNVCPAGVMEWEDNDRMIGSYVMIDPRGRFFDAKRDAKGRIFRTYAKPILECGVDATLTTLNYDVKALVGRGGLYEWRKH